MVEQKLLSAPENVINPVLHISFVWGEENVDFLTKHYKQLHRLRVIKFTLIAQVQS